MKAGAMAPPCWASFAKADTTYAIPSAHICAIITNTRNAKKCPGVWRSPTMKYVTMQKKILIKTVRGNSATVFDQKYAPTWYVRAERSLCTIARS